jgi:hypothetical protein
MAIAPRSEGPPISMYKTYYESAPGIIRSNGEPAVSRLWQAADGSGMWRQSNYWGKSGTTDWTLVSREHMQSKGGVEVEPDFWFFDELVTAYVKFSDFRPTATGKP